MVHKPETGTSESPIPPSSAETVQQPPGARRTSYAERVAARTARRAAAQATAAEVCAELQEPNIPAVVRLVDLFGPALIEAQAAQAQQLVAAAAAGAAPHPVLQTRSGQPRTAGGVFFQLMQEHATGLGLHWDVLALPPPPPKRGTRNAESGDVPGGRRSRSQRPSSARYPGDGAAGRSSRLKGRHSAGGLGPRTGGPSGAGQADGRGQFGWAAAGHRGARGATGGTALPL